MNAEQERSGRLAVSSARCGRRNEFRGWTGARLHTDSGQVEPRRLKAVVLVTRARRPQQIIALEKWIAVVMVRVPGSADAQAAQRSVVPVLVGVMPVVMIGAGGELVGGNRRHHPVGARPQNQEQADKESPSASHGR